MGLYRFGQYTGAIDFLSQKITERFGNENIYTSSADWGGIRNWTVTLDANKGVFILIDDNDEVVLMERKYDDEENFDEDIHKAESIRELEVLFNIADRIKEASKASQPEQPIVEKDFVKPAVMSDIRLHKDKTKTDAKNNPLYHLTFDISGLSVESYMVYTIEELSVKLDIDTENLKKFIK